jgi:hypothetical protein
MARCSRVANRVYNTLSNNPTLGSVGVTFPDGGPGNHYCFQCRLPPTSSLHTVSVSVPPDACGNRSMDLKEYGDEPSTYETCLVDSNGKLTYVDEADYDDVRRFYTVDELVTELVRLANYVTPCSSPCSSPVPTRSL